MRMLAAPALAPEAPDTEEATARTELCRFGPAPLVGVMSSWKLVTMSCD